MKNSQKGYIIPVTFIIVGIIALAVAIFADPSNFQNTDRIISDQEPVACTADAMQCSDGSYVGRSGPNCEFVCPNGDVNTDVSGLDLDKVNVSQDMDLVLYVQDKEKAKTEDCRITQKIIYKVPRTTAVADASLKILFKEELAKYGVYQSVKIEDGVAKIILESDNTPTGKPIGSLSSCESGHLMSVLKDTLTQYGTIDSIELYSTKNIIVF